MTEIDRVLNNIEQIGKDLQQMATSLETLQQRVADSLTNLEDVKTGVLAMKDQNVTQQQVNDSFNQLDAKVQEIQNIITPPAQP
jgi:archaellum component FlaC